MGIQIANPDTMPAVTYDKIHMTKLEILQPIFTNDAAIPKYQVIIYFRHYGISEGVRYYKNEDTQVVSLEDFIQIAMEKAALGDTTLISALSSIEVAVAGIISDQTGVSTSVI